MRTCTPSKLLIGDVAVLREHTLTRWMSRDLTQAAVDFCRNLGLVPAYSECSAEHLTRYLFWQPPQGALFEVRSESAPKISLRKLMTRNVTRSGDCCHCISAMPVCIQPFGLHRIIMRLPRFIWRHMVSRQRRAMMPNKSPEPTAVGACSSAIAVHVASRRWLSFFR